MTARQQAVQFACEGQTLLGVLSLPAEPRPTGVVVVVGGPQYRAGSHRQFVQLARRLAEQGHAVLRFDARGMGDSTGPLHGFEHIGPDIRAAIDTLVRACPEVGQVVLWGLCDGASAALLYLDAPMPDPRVAGLCLLNPWVRTEASLAQTQVKHYYARRVLQRDFWSKLLRGGVGPGALAEFARKLTAGLNRRLAPQPTGPEPYTRRMARAWQRFEGRILLVISERDLTAQEFELALKQDPDWRGAVQRRGVERLELPGSDHTLSDTAGRLAMEARLLQWLGEPAAPAGAAARAPENVHA